MTATAQKNATKESARGAVVRIFALLKAGEYAEIYQYLPNSMQQRTTREQLDQSLSRLQNFLLIDRITVGKTQQSGETAVVETTILGRLKRPLTVNGATISEGRVIAQQILAKEDGQWKLITADNRTRDLFLKEHPDFKNNFRLTEPQLFFRQNGKWMPLATALSRTGRPRPPGLR
ncbi:MAG: hypothetical protein IPM55_11520 [Acidobacteria bacterium]|nr:hypothetical protein [Acidobacteriota bacterium]